MPPPPAEPTEKKLRKRHVFWMVRECGDTTLLCEKQANVGREWFNPVIPSAISRVQGRTRDLHEAPHSVFIFAYRLPWQSVHTYIYTLIRGNFLTFFTGIGTGALSLIANVSHFFSITHTYMLERSRRVCAPERQNHKQTTFIFYLLFAKGPTETWHTAERWHLCATKQPASNLLKVDRTPVPSLEHLRYIDGLSCAPRYLSRLSQPFAHLASPFLWPPMFTSAFFTHRTSNTMKLWTCPERERGERQRVRDGQDYGQWMLAN